MRAPARKPRSHALAWERNAMAALRQVIVKQSVEAVYSHAERWNQGNSLEYGLD